MGAGERAGAPGHCAVTGHTQSKRCVHLSDQPGVSLGLESGMRVHSCWEGSNWAISGSLPAGMGAVFQHLVANMAHVVPA